MRTQEEIVKQIDERSSGDFLGFEVDEYILFLDYEHAKPLIKKGTTKKQWDEGTLDGRGTPTDDALRATMRQYLDFAVEKIINHRGISADRSVGHYRAWFWLLGDDEMVEFIDDRDNYPQYGAPVIAEAHRRLGVTLPDNEDFRRMARGEPCTRCRDGEGWGCGR